MIDRTTCPATRHGTVDAAKRAHCRCPDALEARRALRAARYAAEHGNCHEVDALNIETALIRVHQGGPPPILNIAERRVVATILTEAGWPSRAIATALGLARRSVTRHRHVARVAA